MAGPLSALTRVRSANPTTSISYEGPVADPEVVGAVTEDLRRLAQAKAACVEV
ncbi:MAG TPA: hypothetical protein VGF49_14120 [Candidatus Solibacter sp.]